MENINLYDLTLSDDEELNFDIEEEDESQDDPNLCLVGQFLVDLHVRLKSMKVRMLEVWRKMMGVVLKEAHPSLFLFQFFHKLNLNEVFHGRF